MSCHLLFSSLCLQKAQTWFQPEFKKVRLLISFLSAVCIFDCTYSFLLQALLPFLSYDCYLTQSTHKKEVNICRKWNKTCKMENSSAVVWLYGFVKNLSWNISSNYWMNSYEIMHLQQNHGVPLVTFPSTASYCVRHEMWYKHRVDCSHCSLNVA